MTDTKKPDTCPSCGSTKPSKRGRIVNDPRSFYWCKDSFHDSALPPTPTRETLRNIIDVWIERNKSLRFDTADAWQMACFIEAALQSETFRVATTRVKTAPDNIEKLVRDWYYAPGRIGGPDNLAVLVREIVAAQAAEIEDLRHKVTELAGLDEALGVEVGNDGGLVNKRAEAAEALVEEMRRYVFHRHGCHLKLGIAKCNCGLAALLDRSRKENGA